MTVTLLIPRNMPHFRGLIVIAVLKRRAMSKIERDRMLEAELSFAIAKVLEEYEKRTGLVATNIFVGVTNRRVSEKKALQWTISEVRVDLEDPRKEEM